MAISPTLPPFDQNYKPQFTEGPNPSWTYGQPLTATDVGRKWMDGEKEGWKVIDADKEDAGKLYALMVSGIVPRPIAFVATISDSGVENLSPFSWFSMVTHSPPLISFVCSNGPPRIKDTTINVQNGNGFTVNIISEPFVEQANKSSIDAPEGFDEWAITGLTKAPCVHVKASRVLESAFSMECELFKTIDIVHPVTGVNTVTMVLGLVKYIHVRNDMLTPRGNVDLLKFKPVARMGDITYNRMGDPFRLPRPVWQQEEENIREALNVLGNSELP